MAKQKSITRIIKDEVKKELSKINHDLTRKQYLKNVYRYIEYCRSNHDCKNLEECKEYVQEYINYLVEQNLSASTIHTYCASICKVFAIPMQEIKKPIRHVGEYTKGNLRELNNYRTDQDFTFEENSRLSFFAQHVGIRRNEYKHLTGDDLITKNGKTYVRVKRGKGAKMQLQLVEEGYEKEIAKYFEGKEPEERIFVPADFENRLNLHLLRAKRAQKEYNKQMQILSRHPEHAQELEKIIREYWKTNIDKNTKKPKPFNSNLIKGEYILRGSTRELAIQNNKPIKYNKLVVMYVSLTCLAHYRNNVTIHSYLLKNI